MAPQKVDTDATTIHAFAQLIFNIYPAVEVVNAEEQQQNNFEETAVPYEPSMRVQLPAADFGTCSFLLSCLTATDNSAVVDK